MEHYNKKAKAVELNVGDQVLMRNVRERGGTGKLRSFWEETVFEVVEKRDNVPVFRIRNIKDGRDSRVVHRNLLMKVEQLPLNVFDKPDDLLLVRLQGKPVGRNLERRVKVIRENVGTQLRR